MSRSRLATAVAQRPRAPRSVSVPFIPSISRQTHEVLDIADQRFVVPRDAATEWGYPLFGIAGSTVHVPRAKKMNQLLVWLCAQTSVPW